MESEPLCDLLPLSFEPTETYALPATPQQTTTVISAKNLVIYILSPIIIDIHLALEEVFAEDFVRLLTPNFDNFLFEFISTASLVVSSLLGLSLEACDSLPSFSLL